ncbi:MAG: DDE-type integrase/transposase/recombinase [Erysipelotrichaceae bacterium]|nr:DDE-type integrase/transposase/recombinase [Erysipelotrichaceae bacterium]
MKKQNIDNYEYRKKVADTKHAVIGPVIHNLYDDDSINAYFRRISEKGIEWPDGTVRKYSVATMKRWLQDYRKYNYEGLIPVNRSDAGKSRKLSEEHKAFINQRIEEYPKITGVRIYEDMIKEGLITMNDVSVDTVQRYIKNTGLRNGKTGITKERRGWEFAHSCDGYEADTCHTFYIDDGTGQKRKSYLIAMIDVHSRMIVGAEFFFNDNAANFQKVWKSAVLRYGRSSVLILDNGSSYKNSTTSEIEKKVGTKIIYNPPYSPTGKAIVERFFRTIKDRWLNADKGSNYDSLEALNDKLRSWINDYNQKEHSSLADDPDGNLTPLERYMHDMQGRLPCHLANKSPLEYSDWVDEAFLYEISRRVNGDSTVVIDNVSFDVPSQYIGSKVIIRYQPVEFKTVYLYDTYTKNHVSLVKTDRVENSRVRRTEIIY